MTQVDFYILPEPDLAARYHFVCRLVEKVYSLGQTVCIATEDETETRALDEMLWAHNPPSFIPHSHCLADEGDSQVWLSHTQDFASHHNVLINLRSKLPEHFSRFERLSEVVVQEKSVLTTTRASYRFYQERGYPIRNHDMRKR